jgi:hypothetical protein
MVGSQADGILVEILSSIWVFARFFYFSDRARAVGPARQQLRVRLSVAVTGTVTAAGAGAQYTRSSWWPP